LKLSFFLNKLEVIENEFQQDHKSHSLPTKNIFQLGNLSWDMGTLCALNFGHTSIQNFITHNNIHVTLKNSLPHFGKMFFSSFIKSSNQITLYIDSINSHLIPYAPYNFTRSDIFNLLLSHEIFHFMQCNNLCALYNNSCLNEIAAYAFAKQIHNMHSNSKFCTY